MPPGETVVVYSVKAPDVVTLATLFAPKSVNHKLPSGPAAIPPGAVVVGGAYSVNAPDVVTLATLSAPDSVNQRLPSGPVVMPFGSPLAVGTLYSVKAPEVV